MKLLTVILRSELMGLKPSYRASEMLVRSFVTIRDITDPCLIRMNAFPLQSLGSIHVFDDLSEVVLKYAHK